MKLQNQSVKKKCFLNEQFKNMKCIIALIVLLFGMRIEPSDMTFQSVKNQKPSLSGAKYA